MFVLRNTDDFVDDIVVISSSKESLEEIALSLFEEIWYEWFLIYNCNEPAYITFEEIVHHSKMKAFEDSKSYIIEKVMVVD